MTYPNDEAFNDRIKAMAVFVEARCDEDQMWAVEASRDGDNTVAGGSHWRWVDPETDDTVTPALAESDYLNPYTEASGWQALSLRSVELTPDDEYPGFPSLDLPQFAIREAFEVRSGAAGHIVRNDPARVLLEIAAKRSRVKELRRWAAKADDARQRPDRYGTGLRGEISGSLMAYMHAVSMDAEIWSEHPGYDPSWRVGP